MMAMTVEGKKGRCSTHGGEHLLVRVLEVVRVPAFDEASLAGVQPTHQAPAKPNEAVQGRGEGEKGNGGEGCEVRLPTLDRLQEVGQGRGSQASALPLLVRRAREENALGRGRG
jgi:hypothetical protein